MTWVKLDDGFPSHPKVIGLSDKAFRGYITALCYAAQHLTDGYVPTVMVARRVGVELDGAGLLVSVEGGYLIHDYLEFNRDRATVVAQRELKREAGRSGGLASGRSRRQANTEAEPKQSASGSVELPSRPVQSTTSKPLAPRKRDALFDTLADVTGRDPTAMTRREATACATAIADIRKATPTVTPDEIVVRAEHYRLHMPHATLTPSALANHWSLCANPPKARGDERIARLVKEAMS